MVVVPGVRAVTAPRVSTLATAVSLLLHTPPVPVPVRATVVPLQMVVVAAEIVPGSVAGLTVTESVAKLLQPNTLVTV